MNISTQTFAIGLIALIFGMAMSRDGFVDSIQNAFKPAVKTEGDKEFVTNGMAFATPAEAMLSARNLEARWMAVLDISVLESDEPVNYKYVDGVGEVHL